jgi:phospholipid/cholesterol/gamma-HCH transport system permease protein
MTGGALAAARVRAIGQGTRGALGQVGGGARLAATTADVLVRGQLPVREVTRQMYWMGVGSLPLVLLTAALSGIVTSQQGGYQFTGGIPLYILGSVVTSSIVLELGPVMTAIVMIGRVGARLTAEFGSMAVSEQLDAMRSLGRDPVRELVAPRLVASVLVLPALVAVADLVGVLSGMLAARFTVGLGMEAFLFGQRLYWHNWDLFYSLAKATTFGFVIPIVAMQAGLTATGGADGVGRATTRAVMAMTMAVLILDAVFPALLLN